MGRELQKKKRKSGRPKVQRHKKSNKFALANPIIAANWDKKKTLSQNYSALGLATRLNRQTGGKEPNRNPDTNPTPAEQNSLVIGVSKKAADLESAIQEVRIERDPDTGAILRVLDDPNPQKPRTNPLDDPLNDVDGNEDGDENVQDWLSLGRVPSGSHRGNKTAVIRELEKVATTGVRAAPRTQSEREEDWIQRLVDKHGDNYEAMFRDRKLNVMQQSIGDLKRRVKKWKTAHRAA